MDIDAALKAGIAAHRDGRAEEAEKAYNGVLELHPDQPDALHFLGLLEYERDRPEAAIDLIRRSIDVFGGNPAPHNNLGNILRRVGRFEEALDAYAAAIGIDGGHVDSWNNVGVLLRRVRRGEEAINVLEKAVELAPDHAESWHNLGMTYLLTGRHEDAADALDTCIRLGAQKWSDPVWYARVLCRLGREERAAEVLEMRLAEKPHDEVARFQLSAVRGEAVDRASDGYVRDHFNDFAATFDDILHQLDYRAPALITDAVTALRGDGAPFKDVVDLGCGTGLCGPLIRENAVKLTGVDLSPGMLQKAATRNVYDYLVECELVSFLSEAPPACFDLAISTDVLCYFGPLEEMFSALRPTLKPGGCLIATVERADTPNPPGYELQQSGRYVHNPAYVCAAAETAGLIPGNLAHEVLRRELGQQVEGLLFTVTAPATSG